MVEHYRNRGDKEKQDWHKSIIDKFGSKENLMNNHYSQHITSHTDPSTIRGYVNARRESMTLPLTDINVSLVWQLRLNDRTLNANTDKGRQDGGF